MRKKKKKIHKVTQFIHDNIIPNHKPFERVVTVFVILIICIAIFIKSTSSTTILQSYVYPSTNTACKFPLVLNYFH